MDIDPFKLSVEKGRQTEEARVFALSDTLSVRLAASLPVEVQQAFKVADPTRDIFTGSLHVFNGPTSHAIVVSVQTCFVWKIDLQSPFHSPTCYIFPVPPPDTSSSYLTVPFASLLPFGASREPGLILVSSSGEVRFWDSLGTGLAGAERFSTAKIPLLDTETVDGLEHIDGMVFVARTKTRLYRLTITPRPGTGKFIVVPSPFGDQDDRSASWFSPFRMLQRKAVVWDSGDIITVISPSSDRGFPKSKNAVARGYEERPLWVLTRKSLMKWNVNLGGGEKCIHNHEVREIVMDALFSGAQGDRHSLDIELLDVSIDRDGDPVLLISHEPVSDEELSPLDFNTAPVRVYALVRLFLSPTSDTFGLKGGTQILPYELAVSPRYASSPRVTVLQCPQPYEDLHVTFSRFSDAFAFTAIELPYQEQLHLKNVDDMLLGFCVLEQADGRDMLLLTTEMVLAARLSISNVVKIKDDVHIGKANVLKSTIRQAMKYGIKPEAGNPLRFQLPGIADGESLKTAAEQLSHAFLTSDPDVVAPTLSMGAHLASRERSLEALIMFISESGGLSKLSHTTREQLLANAETLAAARGIWAYHNDQAQKSASPSLLPSAVAAYMRRLEKLVDGEPMRTFFNSQGRHLTSCRSFLTYSDIAYLIQVPYIGALVPEMVSTVGAELSSLDPSQTNPHLLLQANGLVLALFTNALEYRSRNRAKYQLSRAFVQPWTSDPTLIQNLRLLFDATVKLNARSRNSLTDSEGFLPKESIQQGLIEQLRELAGCLFRVYNDRLESMDGRSQDGGGGERERNRLEEEFRALRPIVFGHLVRMDSTEYAFKLAETYRDFHALSELSHHTSADKIIATSDRILGYIDRFRGDFASQLYKWYIEQGKLKSLFDQGHEHCDYVDTFFSENPQPRLSWIHDLGKQDYQHAASALLMEAQVESNRETRHLMLSIGKLSSMAEGPAATSQDKVQAFNNSLDFMAIHHTLLQQFNEELGNPANFAVESRVRAITSARCVVPSDRPALQDLFQRILRQFLQGNALTEEDAVDILSLKDNTEWPTDFVDALIIISNSRSIAENRKATAVQNVWRRIYLHDNWKHIRDTANKTDYELTVKLRKTQLYQVLAASALPNDSIAPPSEATKVPTSEEIELRWPGMAPNQVYELSRDFARESSVLVENGPSDEEFAHVRKLVDEDSGGTF